MQRLISIAVVFLKLGILGFGGPAAHIALMEEEIVQKRRWLTQERFLDLLGATNLIPGPNSTEMAIHLGYLYGGLGGLLTAGTCFILPAVTLTVILAIIYTQFGTLPQIYPFLYGIKPVVLMVIAGALYRLGKKALKNSKLWLIVLVVVGLLLFGVNEVLSLLLGGILGMIGLNITDQKGTLSLLTVLIGTTPLSISLSPFYPPSLWQLGLFFLKVGSVLFGSGYVLIAFLEGELVNQYE